MATATATATTTRRPDQLPPGRHKLGRDTVVASQRARLLGAAVASVAEIGYYHTLVGDIVGRAGVSRKTCYEHFPHGKDQCFLQAYRDHIAAALAGPKSRRLAYLLAYFADRPAAARACLIETAATPELRAMRRQLLGELFTDSTADVGVGALVELVDSALQRGSDLRDLEPQLAAITKAAR